MIVLAVVLGALAIVAWACAWQTMHWLGELEDRVDDALRIIDDDALRIIGPRLWDLPAGVQAGLIALATYSRRTPRRKPL